MSKYSYIVKDANGRAIAEVADAYDKPTLVRSLQEKGYFIVSIQEITSADSLRPKKPAVKRKFTHSKVKLDDLLIFARQLTTMMEAGVTLLRSLDVILSQVESQNFYKMLKKVKEEVEQGTSLSQAMSKHPKVFDQFWVSLVEVGEASGTMPRVLDKLAHYLEQEASFRAAIISALLYPLILLIVALGAIGFFAFGIAPKFETIFKSLGTTLPLITQVLLNLFKFIKLNIMYLLGGMVVIFFIFKKYVSTYSGKMNYEKFLFGLPAVGEIIKLIVVERFASMLAILIDSGVPILQALDITQRLVNNNTCALVIKEIKEGVREGKSLVAPI